MSKDDQAAAPPPGRPVRSGWSLPMSGKTGTTEAHRSSGFLGFTSAFAAANYIYDDSTTPGELCSFPLRQCGRGDLFGGNEPARTWFTAMKPITPRRRALPPTDPRVRRRRTGLEGAEHRRHDPGPGPAAAEGCRFPGRRPGDAGQQRLVARYGRRYVTQRSDGAGVDHHDPDQQRHPAGHRRHRRRGCRLDPDLRSAARSGSTVVEIPGLPPITVPVLGPPPPPPPPP